MSHDEKFPSEQAEEQIARLPDVERFAPSPQYSSENMSLLYDIRHVYQGSVEEDRRSLQHVWKRISEEGQRQKKTNVRGVQPARLSRPEGQTYRQRSKHFLNRPYHDLVVAVVLFCILAGAVALFPWFVAQTPDIVSIDRHATVGSPGAPTSTRSAGRQLIFDDEFNVPLLDSTNWSNQWPDKVTDGSATSTNAYRAGNVTISRGYLNLLVNKEGAQSYTGSMIMSQDKRAFTYGYIEMRAKVPKGEGTQAYFGLTPMGGKLSAFDIDIFTILTHTNTNPSWSIQANTAWMITRWLDTNGKGNGISEKYSGPDFSQDYHTFALDWQPGRLTWYIDGVKRFQVTQHVYAQPMNLVASVAPKSTWFDGLHPDTTTPIPNSMSIDYIRVYR